MINQTPAIKLSVENNTTVLFTLESIFAINKLNPIITSAVGTKMLPKFNISYCVITNKIEPERKKTEPKVIPALYCLRYEE